MNILNLIRVIIRAPIALIWTLAIHHFFIRLPQLFNPDKIYAKPIGVWGRGLAFIMGVRIHKKNNRSGPMGDVIIANHMGFLDIPVLLSFFPSVFMIKMEMRRVFYFGHALEKQGHVFVERGDSTSRHKARDGLLKVLEKGERCIIFPEGQASPGAKRRPFKPFSFAAAKNLDKLIEACVIDYLPDRKQLEWDTSRPMFPQLVDLFGRRRTDISVEFFPAEKVQDPQKSADKWHDIMQGKLEGYDTEREAKEHKHEKEKELIKT